VGQKKKKEKKKETKEKKYILYDIAFIGFGLAGGIQGLAAVRPCPPTMDDDDDDDDNNNNMTIIRMRTRIRTSMRTRTMLSSSSLLLRRWTISDGFRFSPCGRPAYGSARRRAISEWRWQRASACRY